MPDPYASLIREYWDTVLRAYTDFEDKKPVILIDIEEEKVFAYPYREFKAELSDRSQLLLEEQYNSAVRNGEMVVFVRDNRKRKLLSYTFQPARPMA